MSLSLDIIKISKVEDQNIDFKTIIFKISLPQRVSLEFSRENWVILKTLVEGGAQKIYIDFKDNEYIDSAGISVLVRAAKLIAAKNGRIIIANVSQEVMVIFKMINLSNLVDIFATEAEAINSFRFIG